jgi:N-acylneuraminate cytidylyltransferase|tara:strand:+ start:426 stop:2048 length:1623 start_codon:yes stop_codon:yes gene_type:complete
VNNGKITAVIGVRKGSERIVNKNIKPFNDTSLLENKIKILKNVNNLDEIVVTTDCDKMFSLAEQLGVKAITRPEYYTSNDCPGSENLEFIATQVETDYILYTPVTSPLVKSETYEDIINTFRNLDDKYDSVVSMNYLKDFLWENDKPLNYDPLNCPRSQDMESIFRLNFGACLLPRETMIKNKYVVGDNPYWYELTETEGVDVDVPFDFNIAELIYEKNIKKEIDKKRVRILDCTIRDGGFENNFSFTIDEVKKALDTSSKVGYEYFEIGYLTNEELLKKDVGVWKNIPFDLVREIKQDVNPNCKISVMVDSWRYDIDRLLPSSETDIDLIRVCSYEEQLDMSLEKCRKIKELGYEVSLNVICTSYIDIDSFVKIREKLLTEDFLDFLCFADSYGALTPDYVKKIMTLFRNMNPNILIGFHSHDNMSLSMANTITAIENGADMVDGTYTGIGRGGGNLRLELITLYLTLNKGYLFSLVELFEYLDTYITDESRKKRTKEAICGMLNVHPYRLEEIKEKPISKIFKELQGLDLEKKRRYEG